jgi:hypothetical protein
MSILAIIGIVAGALVAVQLLTTAINILQKGGSYKGKSMDEILGVKASSATTGDVEKLSKPQLMQLYYAAPAPDFSKITGEYMAKTLPVGIQAFSADFFTHHFFGPGHWEGKAFTPADKKSGHGYNIFKKGDRIFRTRKMNTYIGKSNIDDRPSFHLDYSPYNKGVVHTMHDELRMVNPTLLIGMGYMGIGGGSINPAPFLVYGTAKKFLGADEDAN